MQLDSHFQVDMWVEDMIWDLVKGMEWEVRGEAIGTTAPEVLDLIKVMEGAI